MSKKKAEQYKPKSSISSIDKWTRTWVHVTDLDLESSFAWLLGNFLGTTENYFNANTNHLALRKKLQ